MPLPRVETNRKERDKKGAKMKEQGKVEAGNRQPLHSSEITYPPDNEIMVWADSTTISTK